MPESMLGFERMFKSHETSIYIYITHKCWRTLKIYMNIGVINSRLLFKYELDLLRADLQRNLETIKWSLSYKMNIETIQRSHCSVISTLGFQT